MSPQSTASILRNIAGVLNDLAYVLAEQPAGGARVSRQELGPAGQSAQEAAPETATTGALVLFLERLLRRLGVGSDVGHDLIATILKLIFEARDQRKEK